MHKIYQVEISRAFKTKRLLIVVLLAAISFVYGYSRIYLSLDMAPLGAVTFWQGILQRGYYGFFASFAAALPFADSLSAEKRGHILSQILTRTNYGSYLRAKFLAAVLSGITAVALPALLLLVFCLMVFPANPLQIPSLYFSTGELFSSTLIQAGSGLNLSASGYLLLCLLALAMFGAAYTVLALGISFLTKNSAFVLGVPFICYSFGSYLIPASRHLKWLNSPQAALIPTGNLFSPLVQYSLCLLVYLLCRTIFGRKERQILN